MSIYICNRCFTLHTTLIKFNNHDTKNCIDICTFIKKHKKKVKKSTCCIFDECNKRPSFNLVGEIRGIYCSQHKLENMINIAGKRCIFDGCCKEPSFNHPNMSKPLYCFEHKLEDMINIVSKRCIFENCNKIPSCNYPTETKGIYCSEHKLKNMIDIKSKRCIFDGCDKISSYNYPTETKGIYCSEHKLEDMINVKSKQCMFDGCITFPLYNLSLETKGIYCIEHKLENMIDVQNKQCAFDGCAVQPVYNLSSETKGIYCFEHKLEDMVDVVHKQCIFENCYIRPSCNYPTEFKAIYCGKHKLENMIDISKKMCQHSKWKNASLFGYLNKRPQFCNLHKEPLMINLILENKCNVPECNNEFSYIVDNIKYCSHHHPDPNNLDIVKRLCKYCDIKEECKYICDCCKKVKNKKEWAIVRYLHTAIDTSFTYDSSKMLQGCSKKRPDIFFDLPKHCVIVEIDENQHKSYEDVCECARINEIVNGIGGRSVIIIRYNPDIIKNNGKEVNILQSDKIDLLVKTIKEQLVCNYDTFIVKTIQLYYNDNYETYVDYKEENITDIVCI